MSGSLTKYPHDQRRWLILGVIALAQLMVVLDVTIVTIALPSAQADLGFDADSRQWVMTAYALAFGSLLLLGGKVSDVVGRKWTFIAGLAGFAAASALGGAASSFGVLVGARAMQGLFAALLAPAALSIVATTFTDPQERGKAFGIYGAIASVYGFSNAETNGWGAPLTIAPLTFGAAAVAGFVAIERNVRAPLLPLRVVGNRNRGPAFLAVSITASRRSRRLCF
jgi:MFS family permease